MALEPIVIQMKMPEPIGPMNKLPRFGWLRALSGTKSTKIITFVAAFVITLTMVTITLFTLLANNKSFQKLHSLVPLGSQQQSSGSQKSLAAAPGGGTATGVGGTSGTDSPVVTITATPASVKLGGISNLKWSVTNNPSSCTASDDWAGAKPASGSASTPALTKAQTYLFTLTCQTATGTGFATVSVGTLVQSGGSGSVTARPSITFAANPTSAYVGESSSLIWSATNNPTSCTASGDWSGVEASNGSVSTGTLTSARQYNYTLQCSNSAGTSPSVTVGVLATNPPPGLPVVTISANPLGPITPGSSTTLTWSVTNSPSSCTASGDWSGDKAASGSASSGALSDIRGYVFTLTCTNSSKSSFSSAAVQVLPNPPTVSLSVSPTSILVGGDATLTWSVVNNTPNTSCTGTGDWASSSVPVRPTSGGTRDTGTLTTPGTYLYSLSCTNEGGTGFQNNVPLTVSLPSAPVVSISVSPISITSGQSATISWSVTNNPTACTPSNDLKGTVSPLSGGSESTGTLTTAKTYNYSLTCSNAGGTSATVSTTLSVGAGKTSNPPVVTISVSTSPSTSPPSISTGGSATVSWSATNSPTSCSAGGTTSNWVTSPGASGTVSTGPINTAGTRTYSITCSNSAGSGTGTTNPGLKIVALPTVSVLLGSPGAATASINTGASTIYSWSTTGASSCSGSGSLSGSMASSGGPITTGVINSPGTYSYTVTCVNSIGGTASSTATLTVSNAAKVYCSGNTPCFGPSDLATHTSQNNCWGYNLNRVVNVTSLNNGYHSGGPGNLLPNSYTGICGNVNLAPFLNGSASIPGLGSHSHSSSTENNSGTIGSYLTGYYDATNPN